MKRQRKRETRIDDSLTLGLGVELASYGPTSPAILLEDGTWLLLETGDYMLLEA